MEYGVCLHPTDSPLEQARLAKLSEELGYSFVGMGDSQLLWDDVYADLALAAKTTSRMRLGPWVTNLVTRHPTVTARAIATIDRISGGRAFLGISTGDSSLYSIGERPLPLRDCEARLGLLKRCLVGEEKFSGTDIKVKMPKVGSIPIYWAARGLRSLEFGGKQAEGVIIGGWASPPLLKYSVDRIQEARRQVTTNPGEIKIILHTAFAVSFDGKRAKEEVKPFVARAARDLPKDLWRLFPTDFIETIKMIDKAYVYAHHLEQSHTEVTRLVNDSMVDAFSIAGSPGECVEKIRQIEKCGVTDICSMPLASREKAIHDLAKVVLVKL